MELLFAIYVGFMTPLGLTFNHKIEDARFTSMADCETELTRIRQKVGKSTFIHGGKRSVMVMKCLPYKVVVVR